MAYRNDLIGSDAVAVTNSDTTFLNLIGIYVGTTGDVTVTTAKGNLATFKTVPAGAQIALGIIKVMATGTTASNITGIIA